jgi:hypothetical protein
MSIGYPVTKQRIDAQGGDAVYQTREALARVSRFKADLDQFDDAELEGLGYTAGEVTTLRATFTDLANLAKIADGQGTQAQPNDFFFHADNMIRLS